MLAVLAAVALVAMLFLGIVLGFAGGRSYEAERRTEARATALGPPSSPSPVALPAPPAFARTLRSDHFAFATDAGLELERQALAAETTLARTRSWVGLAAPSPARFAPFDVYLCGAAETIHAIEAAHGLPVSTAPGRSFPFMGGCYAPSRFIAVLSPDVDPDGALVAHEVAHLVFHELTTRQSNALDEGFAHFVSDWIMSGGDASAEEFARSDPAFLPIDVAAEYRALPRTGLRELLELGYWQFRASETNSRHFTSADMLTRCLIGSDDTRIRGRYVELLREFGRHGSPWHALAATYDTAAVEGAWHAALERLLAAGSVFGEWRRDGAVIRGRADGRSSSALVRVAPSTAEGWSISYGVTSEPGANVSFGFTLGFADARNFTYVELVPRRRVAQLAFQQNGAWSSQREFPLAVDAFAGQCIELACDAQGVVTLAVGSRQVFAHPLGERALRGRHGLMMCLCDPSVSASDSAELEFADVRFAP